MNLLKFKILSATSGLSTAGNNILAGSKNAPPTRDFQTILADRPVEMGQFEELLFKQDLESIFQNCTKDLYTGK